MWISGAEYKRLKNCERMRETLEKEVERLAELISSEVEGCKVGPWGKDCNHVGDDEATVLGRTDYGLPYVAERAGQVQYCKKHLHEVCPEFERR